MLSLNLIVRAVIVHEGRFLVTAFDDGQRELFYTFLGGHLALGETLTECAAREVREETGLNVIPSRLLYIAENFFRRGSQALHEIGYYFLCHPAELPAGGLLESISPNLAEFVSPELRAPAELPSINFQPALLARLAAADLAGKFADCPKLVVINELPGEVRARTGVYAI